MSFRSLIGSALASIACMACDGGSANDAFPGDPSGRSGNADAGEEPKRAPVAALALAACVPAGYTLPVTIGGSEPFDITIDTGSTSLGVASAACSGCDVEPKLTPNENVSALGLEAKSQYAIGGWSGKVYEGEVALGGAVKAAMRFVAIDEHHDFFGRQTCGGSKSRGVQGIMGLGPAAGAVVGTNGFLDQLVSTSKMPDVFATELRDDGGTLWLGGYEPTRTTAAPRYTPLLRGTYTAYAVELASIRVDGVTVPVATSNFERAVVDTGASAFLLASTSLESVGRAIAGNAQFASLVGEDAGWLDNVGGRSCKKLKATKRELDASLPSLTLTFGSGSAAFDVPALPTESYLAFYGGQWCSTLVGFEPSDNLPFASILGAPILRSSVVVFDREERRIGFAPHVARE